MPGLQGLFSRLKKCQNKLSHKLKKPKRSIIHCDEDGNLIIEDGVEYNDFVLVAPLPVTVEEWQRRNIEDEKP